MTGPVITAHKLNAMVAPAEGQDFTYVVVVGSPTGKAATDRRAAPRQRTRLRSGKVVSEDGRFVTECLVHDLSATGGRLRHPASVQLPRSFQLYDDQTEMVRYAVVLWRKGQETGIRFLPDVASARSRAVAREMRRRFYAVPR